MFVLLRICKTFPTTEQIKMGGLNTFSKTMKKVQVKVLSVHPLWNGEDTLLFGHKMDATDFMMLLTLTPPLIFPVSLIYPQDGCVDGI